MAAYESKNEGISENPVMREYSGEKHGTVEDGGLSDPNHVELQRALKARHITMIGMHTFRTRAHKS